jgi:hypothetical protein
MWTDTSQRIVTVTLTRGLELPVPLQQQREADALAKMSSRNLSLHSQSVQAAHGAPTARTHAHTQPLAPMARWQLCGLPTWRNSAFRESGAIELCPRRNWLCVCVCVCPSVAVQTGKSRWNSKSSTLELQWAQHDRPAACVIAQQYSSVTFVSLRFYSRKEKLGAPLKTVLLFKKLN